MYENNDDIDLIELFKKLYKQKLLIYKVVIVSAVLGVISALFQSNEYTSSTTFIPQLSSGFKTAAPLGSLASLTGINLGSLNNSSSEFPPSLYPQVVNGIPFKLDLLSSNIYLNNEAVLVKDYLADKPSSFSFVGIIKKYTIGLPGLIIGFFKSNEILNNGPNSEIYTINKESQELFNLIDSNLFLSINDKEGFITISYTDYNKNVAAQITQIAQNLLQEKIIEFKNKSSNEILDFALKQYSEKKESYENLQDQRAVFVDQNINISSSLFQNKLNRIESELSISESIVKQLASQVEQAKLQVNKDTPVFTTIQPVTIPFKRSAPNRVAIVFIYIFSGLVLSVCYIFMKAPFFELLNSIKT